MVEDSTAPRPLPPSPRSWTGYPIVNGRSATTSWTSSTTSSIGFHEIDRASPGNLVRHRKPGSQSHQKFQEVHSASPSRNTSGGRPWSILSGQNA